MNQHADRGRVAQSQERALTRFRTPPASLPAAPTNSPTFLKFLDKLSRNFATRQSLQLMGSWASSPNTDGNTCYRSGNFCRHSWYPLQALVQYRKISTGPNVPEKCTEAHSGTNYNFEIVIGPWGVWRGCPRSHLL